MKETEEDEQKSSRGDSSDHNNEGVGSLCSISTPTREVAAKIRSRRRSLRLSNQSPQPSPVNRGLRGTLEAKQAKRSVGSLRSTRSIGSPTLRGLRKNRRPSIEDEEEEKRDIEGDDEELLIPPLNFPGSEEEEEFVVPSTVGGEVVVEPSEGSAFEDEEDIQVSASFRRNPPGSLYDSSETTELIEAILVDGDDVMVAHAVDVTQMAEKEKIDRKNQQIRLALILACFLLLATGIAVGIVLGVGNESASRTSPPSSAPTAPPKSPMDELTLQLSSDTMSRIRRDRRSPQAKAFNWLSAHQGISKMELWRKVQVFALAAVFFALKGEHWPQTPNARTWLDDQVPECGWEWGVFWALAFVECNNNDRVTQLRFEHLFLGQLQPTIPPEINLLTDLGSLVFHSVGVNTSLGDFLPEDCDSFPGNLRELHLDKEADLIGPLPTSIGCLGQLTTLRLELTGINGQIPSEVGHMTNLQTFFLQANAFVGSTLPSEIGLLTNLQHLTSFKDGFHGTIPSEIGQLTLLTNFAFYGNSLTGVIPSTVGLLSNLAHFDLQANWLSGTIPSEIGMLTKMDQFRLDFNSFSGPIPTELGRMTEAVDFSLDHNSLTGDIPSELGLMNTTWMETLNNDPYYFGPILVLSHNFLSGSLPSDLGAFHLAGLVLRDNSLTGSIPSELGELSLLSVLDLTNNNISGLIPSELGLLSLVSLFLENNTLISGTFPAELEILFHDRFHITSLNIRGTSISGTMPESFCRRGCSSIENPCAWIFDCSAILCGCDCSCDIVWENATNITTLVATNVAPPANESANIFSPAP